MLLSIRILSRHGQSFEYVFFRLFVEIGGKSAVFIYRVRIKFVLPCDKFIRYGNFQIAVHKHFICFIQLHVKYVHRRRAYKPRNENISGVVIDFFRRSYLLNKASAHYHNTACHCHSFRLIVRHVYSRRVYAVMQFNYFRPHGKAQFRIQIRQRLVHHENGYVFYNRPAERDTLHLSTRKFFRKLIKIWRQIELFRSFVNSCPDFVRRVLAVFDFYISAFVKFVKIGIVLRTAFFHLLLFRFDKRLQFRTNRSFYFFLFTL